MKINLVVIRFLILTFALFVVGVALLFPSNFGFCPSNVGGCAFRLEEAFAQPVLISTVALFVIFLLLLFLNPLFFVSWKKFAIWYIPVASLLIAITPTIANDFAPDRELVTLFLSGLYVALSLLVIGIKYLRLRSRG